MEGRRYMELGFVLRAEFKAKRDRVTVALTWENT